MANINIPEKIYKYESFLNDVLKEELKKTQLQLDRLYTEVAEFVQLKHSIEIMNSCKTEGSSLKTTVDIGCNFLMKAKISDTRTVYVDIGCGYFVQYSLTEAINVINKRIEYLEKQIAIYKKQSATTKAHIKMVLLGLMEIQKM
ncbi:hypothetical protein O3M35_012752 [Rhynocoris fuscipes]|uniref:Protein UXT n=1 Tax=Rhynocoris fuscipes TaxID=488301 RepID=A0AAW1CTH4_9HEMI